MAAVTTVALFDALATPVSHSFIPLGPDAKNVWWFEDQSRPSPVGFWRVSMSLTRPGNPAPGSSASDRLARVKIALHMPSLETVANNSAGLTPAPVVAYILRSSQEFLLPERATVQERKDIRKMSRDSLDLPAVVAMIETLQGLF